MATKDQFEKDRGYAQSQYLQNAVLKKQGSQTGYNASQNYQNALNTVLGNQGSQNTNGIYDLRNYGDFSQVDAALTQQQDAEAALNNMGNHEWGRQDAYDTTMDSILNAKPFEYDFNTDAMYQMYKDQYAAMGNQAMEDTIGKTAAMTGGYGNSYAATAGNQAYQSYLQQANEMIPQLYNMALERYRLEQDQKQSALNALNSDYDRSYGEWNDEYNRKLSDRDYYSGKYNNAYDRALQMAQGNYGIAQDEKEFNYQRARDAVTDSQWQKQFDRNAYEYDTSLAFDKERAAVSDSQWQKQFDRDVYESDRDYDRGVYESDRNYDRSVLESDRAYNRGVYEYDTNLAYQKERDAVSDSQWQQQLNYNKSQNSQSAYIKQLEQQNAQYEADNKVDYSLIKNLKADMISKTDFENYASNVTATAGGKRKVLSYRVDGKSFGSYQDYVKYYLQKRYDNGDINYGTLNEMLDQYGI